MSSLDNWKDKFYKVKANSHEALKSPAKHSLIKWIGLRKR